MKMKQIVSKYETLINIINYVLCDLYACKNLMIKSLFFKIKDFYLRRRFKVKYLSKHYISDMERKYDMEFFENRISFMLLMLLGVPFALFLTKLFCLILHIKFIYIFYTIQFFIVVTLFKFAFYKKRVSTVLKYLTELGQRIFFVGDA